MTEHDSAETYACVEAFGKQLESSVESHMGTAPTWFSPLRLLATVAALTLVGGGGVAAAELLSNSDGASASDPVPLVVDGTLTGEFGYSAAKYGAHCQGDQFVVDLTDGVVTIKCPDGSDPGLTTEESEKVRAQLQSDLESAAVDASDTAGG